MAVSAVAVLLLLLGAPATAQEAGLPQRVDMIDTTPPTADFSIDPPQGVVSTTFFFDALASADNEDSDAWLLVRFDFEDDGAWDTIWLNPTNPARRHTYTSTGIYTTRLEVKDRDELTATTTRSVEVGDPGTNAPPTAACNVSPQSGPPGTTFTFEATASADAEEATSALVVKWDQYGTFDFRGQSWQPATQPISFTYTGLGIQRVDLIVMDTGFLMDTAECEVEIEPPGGNTAPTADLVISPTHGTTTTPYSLDARGSHDDQDAIASLSVRFDWTDDGVYDSSWLNASQLWEHTFGDVWGAITVRAQVRDSGGLTDEITQTVTVSRIFQIHLPALTR